MKTHNLFFSSIKPGTHTKINWYHKILIQNILNQISPFCQLSFHQLSTYFVCPAFRLPSNGSWSCPSHYMINHAFNIILIYFISFVKRPNMWSAHNLIFKSYFARIPHHSTKEFNINWKDTLTCNHNIKYRCLSVQKDICQ